ncbi:MAG: hypothetical protein ACPG51_19500, partial [Thiolinea sp.]
MMTYLIQTGLMLLGAFVLGLIIGKVLKRICCRPGSSTAVSQDDYDAPGILVASPGAERKPRLNMTGDLTDEPVERKSRLSMSDTGVAIAATATAAAGAKIAIDAAKPVTPKPSVDIEVNEPDVDLPEIDFDVPGLDKPVTEISKPEPMQPVRTLDDELPRIAGLELSDFSMQTPEVEADLSDVTPTGIAAGVGIPEVDVAAPDIELPEVNVHTQAVDLPEIDLPDIEMDVPEAKASEVNLADLSTEISGAKVKAPDVDLPEVDVDLPEIDLPDA